MNIPEENTTSVLLNPLRTDTITHYWSYHQATAIGNNWLKLIYHLTNSVAPLVMVAIHAL